MEELIKYPFTRSQKINRPSSINGNAQDEWETEAYIDVKHIGAYGIGDSHVTKPIPGHYD